MAARKKAPNKKKDEVITLSYAATKDYHEKLALIGHGNRSKGLRQVVDKYKHKIPKADA